MNAYTISRLAQDAGVSAHVVRDYVLRGLLQPTGRTACGYWVFDERSLERLRFLRAAFEFGIGLDELRRLFQAVDARNSAAVMACAERMNRLIAARQELLSVVKAELADLVRGGAERRAAAQSRAANGSTVQRALE